MTEKKYPYLGRNYIDGKAYIVLFTEEEYGIVLLNETQSETIQFAKIMSFDESQFEILPPEECVRLSN